MRLLRYWLIGTCIVIAGLATWAFAPFLVFVVLLTIGLGAISMVMVVFARALGAWLDRQ